MHYADARPLIRSGDLLAWTHRGWGSWYDVQIQAVRAFTRSEYSHVGLAWVAGGRVWCIESVVPHIRAVPLRNLVAPHGLYWLPLHHRMDADELAFALSRVGLGAYSKWQAVRAALGLLRVGADDLWECAEFVIAARRRGGLDLGDVATPTAVVRHAQEHHGASCTLVMPDPP